MTNMQGDSGPNHITETTAVPSEPDSSTPMSDQQVDQPEGSVIGQRLGKKADPVQEDTYWREAYRSKPYFTTDLVNDPDLNYDRDYNPAYRLGYENRQYYPEGKSFEEVETDLSTKWEQFKGESRLKWEQAKHAVKDAWERLKD